MNIISQCRETSVADSLQRSASGHEHSEREMFFFPWRLVPFLEWRQICQHTNEDVKYSSWSRHTWTFPRASKDYTFPGTSTGITYFQKQGNEEWSHFEEWSVLLLPTITKHFQTISLPLVRLVTLFIPLFKLLREERIFYCFHEAVVAQGVGKGTQTKERRYVGRFGFCSLST